MAPLPKYLTGDKEGIKKFIDQFDVSTPTCISRARLFSRHALEYRSKSSR